MSQAQQDVEIGWKCPVDMCGKGVFPNPIVALRHTYRTDGDGHGEADSLPENPWPNKVRKEPDVETANKEFKRWLRQEFDGGEDIYKQLVEVHDMDLPPVLTEFEMQNFRAVEAHDEFKNDIEVLERFLESIDEVLNRVIRDANQLQTEIEVQESVEEEEEDDDDEVILSEEAGGGRYSKADLMDAEEEEVFTFMERSGVLDDAGEDSKKAFRYIYRNRDEDEVTVQEVASELNCPPGAAADTLDLLVDRNLIDEDQSNDTFSYPY